jgi:hypothetical protein
VGGKIEHREDGSPNGLLRASAKSLVRTLLAEPTVPELIEAIDTASRQIAGARQSAALLARLQRRRATAGA